MTNKQSEQILLLTATDLSLNDKGNIWLISELGHNAWLRLGQSNFWLEISIRLQDYPSLTVKVTAATEEELRLHIKTNFSDSWINATF